MTMKTIMEIRDAATNELIGTAIDGPVPNGVMIGIDGEGTLRQLTYSNQSALSPWAWEQASRLIAAGQSAETFWSRVVRVTSRIED
jgi:hypothetical protein